MAKMSPNTNMEPEKRRKMIRGTEEWINSNVRTGRLENPFALADQRGWMGILNVHTIEELDDMVQEHPTSVFEKIEVHPLADIHHALGKMKEMAPV